MEKPTINLNFTHDDLWLLRECVVQELMDTEDMLGKTFWDKENKKYLSDLNIMYNKLCRYMKRMESRHGIPKR